MWIILLFTLCSIWILWTKWKLSYWQRLGVPGPEPNLFFGNVGPVITMQQHMGSLTSKWYSEFKNIPYIGYYKLTTPAIVLRDSDLIKNVLIEDYKHFAENDLPIIEKYDPLIKINPFSLIDERWRRARNIMVPTMTAGKIKGIYPKMESACQKLTNYLRSQPRDKDYDAKSLSAKFSTENVVKCLFSLNANCFEPGTNELRDRSKSIFEPSFMAAISFLMTPVLPRWLSETLPISKLPPSVEIWFRKLLRENIVSRKTTQTDDLLDSLMKSSEKFDVNEYEMAGYAFTLFHEGFETASTVLSFILYEIAKNPEIQQRVYDEIIDVSSRFDNKFSYDAMKEMMYLESVMQESHRLHPVILQMPKMCTEEYTLPRFGNQKEGVKIYPGTAVIIPLQAIHLDPEIYPNPNEFNPDRFSKEESFNRHNAHYLAFGVGPRMCVGMRFGHAQTKAALITIIKDFIIKLSPKQKPVVVDPISLFNAAKDGIYLNFDPR